MCGPLNFRLVAADKWHMLRDLLVRDTGFNAQNMDLEYLNQLIVPKNEELGRFIQNLYARKELFSSNPQLAMTTNEDQFKSEENAHKTSFPSYHNLKLCILGKSYSGKKT